MKACWAALKQHHEKVCARTILSLFTDEDRFDARSAVSDGLLLDYSKTNIDGTGLELLCELFDAADVAAKRAAMFAGEKINTTENRAVLHTALRRQGDDPLLVDGENIMPEIHKTRARMEQFCTDIRSGAITASDGTTFTDVINIGIGGSDLGPAMAAMAMAPCHDGPRVHFVSNVDGAHIGDTLRGLEAARTLVVITSKTFTTIETMTNAKAAIDWLEASLGHAAPTHLAAVSSATDKTQTLGIDPARVFGFGDYVGGRYSLWGPVGLSLMLAIGPHDFARFLAGAAAMDRHFQTAEPRDNLPVLLAMIGVWHHNICGYPTRAILPYDQRLSRLPAYFQQLDMESNGKSVALDGSELETASGPIVWGEPGTNGQHAFYQLLHQGTAVVPAEFLIAARGHEENLSHQHDLLKANCLAQSQALMVGRTLPQAREIAAALGFEGDELDRQAAHRVFVGNRPSITLAYDKLTPFTLGQIIAMYEHRVFVEGAIWGINSFDQWGVELGKELAVALLPLVQGEVPDQINGSTAGLLQALKAT
ncbi:MAG: glucose-6-phosphate isomerase [Alphaproteobacteria bacterium]|nr:glucose-6-phosphate isomerase [Alphaproteobacteria bacterium]